MTPDSSDLSSRYIDIFELLEQTSYILNGALIHHLLASPNSRPKNTEVITKDQKDSYRFSPFSNRPDGKYYKSPVVD